MLWGGSLVEDLTYEELWRRGNPPVPDRITAVLQQRGEGRRSAAGEVLLLPRRTVAELIQVDPEIGDLLLSAFAARRLMLLRRGQGTRVAGNTGGR